MHTATFQKSQDGENQGKTVGWVLTGGKQGDTTIKLNVGSSEEHQGKKIEILNTVLCLVNIINTTTINDNQIVIMLTLEEAK